MLKKQDSTLILGTVNTVYSPHTQRTEILDSVDPL